MDAINLQEFRVPKTPPVLSTTARNNSNSGKKTPVEVTRRNKTEKWIPANAYFSANAVATHHVSQSERKPAVRDSVARIRQENLGKVRELAQQYDKEAGKRRESFVAPKNLFKGD